MKPSGSAKRSSIMRGFRWRTLCSRGTLRRINFRGGLLNGGLGAGGKPIQSVRRCCTEIGGPPRLRDSNCDPRQHTGPFDEV